MVFYKELIEKISTEKFSSEKIFSNKIDKARLITFCNPYSFKLLDNFKGYITTLQKFDYVFADGILLVKLCSLFKKKVFRISFDGNSISQEVFKYCVDNKLKVVIIGGSDSEIKKAKDKIINEFDLSIIGFTGFFDDWDESIKTVLNCHPDVVIVGMGAPIQDEYLIALSESGFKGVGFTCGGYITQIANSKIVYYPAVINFLNLRSIYRIYKEPKRLIRRYSIDYLPFYKYYIKSLFSVFIKK